MNQSNSGAVTAESQSCKTTVLVVNGEAYRANGGTTNGFQVVFTDPDLAQRYRDALERPLSLL